MEYFQRNTEEKKMSLKILPHLQKAKGSSVVNLTNYLKTATATIKCGEGPNVDIPQTGDTRCEC